MHYDPDPICSIHGADLNLIDLGDKYGEGLYCFECMYWWPQANYYPNIDEIHTREGEQGKRIPWEIMRDILMNYLTDDQADSYYEGYKDAQEGKPNRYEKPNNE
ncbi:hypothetical protein KIH79_09160 [Bifidobacterium sp. 82T10]|uniref:Uncharacterized protein n=1 Tax=Bifidobacterium miconis TaxID=2834435 RepID=A0ABS6WH59_9BIFI|nr:hypothetical protein [Bifidobacterium miconis]MBW3093085.1 hypothetical protein [Bifidobacterium miconis]